MYRLYCFEYGETWSSLEQSKQLQNFLLDREAKFTSLSLEQGQGFTESAEPLSKFLWSMGEQIPTCLHSL